MLLAVLPSRSATSLAVSPPGELCKISRTRSVRTGSIDCPRNGPHLRTINEPVSWRKRERYRRHGFQWDVADVQQPQALSGLFVGESRQFRTPDQMRPSGSAGYYRPVAFRGAAGCASGRSADSAPYSRCPESRYNGGSGVGRRPSGLPSIADLLLCRRKPPLRATSGRIALEQTSLSPPFACPRRSCTILPNLPVGKYRSPSFSGSADTSANVNSDL
jgi:hypothetical protein